MLGLIVCLTLVVTYPVPGCAIAGDAGATSEYLIRLSQEKEKTRKDKPPVDPNKPGGPAAQDKPPIDPSKPGGASAKGKPPVDPGKPGGPASKEYLKAGIPAAGATRSARTEATIKGRTLVIEYVSFLVAEREAARAMLGTNQSADSRPVVTVTVIETDRNLIINGKELSAGAYSLWLRQTADGSPTLSFHPRASLLPSRPPEDGYLADLPVAIEKTSESADRLTIKLAEERGQAVIVIQFGTVLLKGRFGVK